MKILMINHFPLAGSGSGTYTKNLAVHLAQLGHEVCVILPENTDSFERVPGIRLHPVYFSPNDGAPGLESDASSKAADKTTCERKEADQINADEAIGAGEAADVSQAGGGQHDNDSALGATPADALPFNFPCFTTHPRSITAFDDLDEAQMAQYTRAFTAAIEEEIGANRPDVIHGQHVWVLPALAAGRGIPLVLTAHGTDLMGYDKWPKLRSYAETAMDACSAVISISKDNCELLEERFPQHKDKIVMMRNGYDPGVFYPEDVTRGEVLGQYGIDPADYEGRKIVSFAGKLAHFKGVDILLDAVSLIEDQAGRQADKNVRTLDQARRQTGKNVRTQVQAGRQADKNVRTLDQARRQTDNAVDTQNRATGISDMSVPEMIVLIVGDGDERDALHAQAKKLGLQTVRFLGSVDQQALRHLYNIADVSLVPSRREPFGLVAIEAMACGIPVIATNQGGLPDFVNESVGALCAPEDAEDLARTILATLEREEHTDMDAWRADIAHYARTHYAQDTIIKELENLYKKALDP